MLSSPLLDGAFTQQAKKHAEPKSLLAFFTGTPLFYSWSYVQTFLGDESGIDWLGFPDSETDQELAHEHISHLSVSEKKVCLEVMDWKGELAKCDSVSIRFVKDKYLEMVGFSVIR